MILSYRNSQTGKLKHEQMHEQHQKYFQHQDQNAPQILNALSTLHVFKKNAKTLASLQNAALMLSAKSTITELCVFAEWATLVIRTISAKSVRNISFNDHSIYLVLFCMVIK
jgi:hypothetical protein